MHSSDIGSIAVGHSNSMGSVFDPALLTSPLVASVAKPAAAGIATPIRIEAESMIANTYRLEPLAIASSGQVLSLKGGTHHETGSASFDFTGPSGQYDVMLGYFDEADGIAGLAVQHNDTILESWDLDRQLGDNWPTKQTQTTHTVATQLAVRTGDTFKIAGQEAGSLASAEHARIDFIEFIATPTPDTNPGPPVPPPSAPSSPSPDSENNQGKLSGELKTWHPITVSFQGPHLSETSNQNPFRDYRLDVTFTHTQTHQTLVVPGYFAADGNAAETSATQGTVWRAHLSPPLTGDWTYQASFRHGEDIAASLDSTVGHSAGFFDTASGTFTVASTDKTGSDMRGKGLLQYVGERYLQHAETGDYFLKAGANSPENLLAYRDFDNTVDLGKAGILHRYTPHIDDWETGDPTWQDGKGKGLIGAINYLASEGVNTMYFLTMTVNGDGHDTWPWIEPDRYSRYDVSKLAQWEIAFDHMQRQGIAMHVVTQEHENDQLLGDGDELTEHRAIYYRELVARFGHHNAITWNLGEENTNTDAMRRAIADYIKAIDPYDHSIVVHTHPYKQRDIYTPLLGYESIDGLSLQTSAVHQLTQEWLEASQQSGRPWVVTSDETMPWNDGVVPDAVDPTHDLIRQDYLWGNLMAGGGGVEWYFGLRHPHNDLTLEDYRTRDTMWDQTRYAIDFFQSYLPFTAMNSASGLTSNTHDWVLAKPGEVYAIYLPNGGSTTLDLSSANGTFDVAWFNPRQGGKLKQGSTSTIKGGAAVDIGYAPYDRHEDWVVLVRQ